MILAEPGATRWDLKWSMFGIPCRVHPGFWLTALLFNYNFDSFTPFSYIAVGVACMFVSIVIHEYGHAFAGRYYGDDQNHTVLYSMGGLCVAGRGIPDRMPRIIQLLWGPGAGFILAAIAFALQFAVRRDYIPIQNDLLLFTIANLVYINFIWGVVNLFPVFPLDGGQILGEWVRWKAPHRGDVFSLTVSLYTAIGLAVAFLGFAIWESMHGAKNWRAMYPVFLFGMLAYNSYQYRQQIIMYGGMEGAAPERREAWEQDPDWWKRGGR